MSLFEINPTSFELVYDESTGYSRVSGLAEVTQGCHHRVNLIRGEARFAADRGILFFESPDGQLGIHEKGMPVGIIESMFQAQINDVAGVESVDWLRMTQDETEQATRHAHITYSAKVSLGELRADVTLTETAELRTTS